MQNVLDIQHWYKNNFRDLPWRRENDPYKIWLSEIILQQTQVIQGLAYYEKFINEYPTLRHLSAASEEEVLKLWQGLGYYSRARNLHKAAKIITDEHHAIFPDDFLTVVSLPGIGDYTASAILSFAFGKSLPTLDGNVFRLLSRLYDMHLPIDENSSRKVFKEILFEMIKDTDPALFNNAMMELGAIICRPMNPKCEICPVNDSCLALKNGTIMMLPVKKSKVKVRVRHFNFFYLTYKDHFYLVKRTDNDIWKNMYQFPLMESDAVMDEAAVYSALKMQSETIDKLQLHHVSTLKHKLTHQTIMAKFWRLESDTDPNELFTKLVKVNMKNYIKYPLPVLIDNFLLSL